MHDFCQSPAQVGIMILFDDADYKQDGARSVYSCGHSLTQSFITRFITNFTCICIYILLKIIKGPMLSIITLMHFVKNVF